MNCRRQLTQGVDFAFGRRVVGGVVGELGSNIRRDPLVSSMHGSDGLEQFLVHVSLKNVPASTGSEGTQHLDVARRIVCSTI